MKSAVRDRKSRSYRFPVASLAALATVLSIGACGGGGGGTSGAGPSGPRPVAPGLIALPAQGAAEAASAPVLYSRTSLHVGADVAPSRRSLSPAGNHGGVRVRVSHGRVADGIGATELIAYLRADAANNVHDLYPDGYLHHFGSAPPTVRVAQGTTTGLLDQTVRAVQLINAALPRTWQLKFSATPLPASTEPPPDREILVEFAPRADWSLSLTENYTGYGQRWTQGVRTGDPQRPWVLQIMAGRVWVDHTRVTGQDRMEIMGLTKLV